MAVPFQVPVDERGFTYRATYWAAYRTFRLLRQVPLRAEFFSVSYVIEYHTMKGADEALALAARLPWQDSNSARHLQHINKTGGLRELYVTGYDVDCGTLCEVIFLRLARQGDAEELAGPHCKVVPPVKPIPARVS